MRSVLSDCARVNRENPSPSTNLTSDLLSQALLNIHPKISDASNMETETANSHPNDLSDL